MRASVWLRVVCVAALLPALAAAQSTVYRWVDKEGKVHYTDEPPPSDARQATQKRMGGGGAEVENLPYATQIAARRNPVTLYAGSACGDTCANARELLVARGIPFSEKDAQTNPEDREALQKLVGAPEVPTVSIGSNALRGFSEEEWQQALDSAGYPRTRLPGQAGGPRPAPPKPDAAKTEAPKTP